MSSRSTGKPSLVTGILPPFPLYQRDMSVRVENYAFQTPKTASRAEGGSSNMDDLWMTAKRYTKGESSKNKKGLTLLFTHCNGAFKEEWEIVIELLFRLNETAGEAFQIREAWTFDRQNHGDAAVLNSRVLGSRPGGVSLYEWSAALVAFVRSPHMEGHRMVVVGHSAGSTAWALTTKEFPKRQIPYVAIIAVESTIVNRAVFERDLEERMQHMDFVVNATQTRRDRWSSPQEAFKYFSKRLPWSVWDPRSIQLLVDYGLQSLPNHADGVTLKCPKEQEAISYPDKEPHFESDTQLGEISRSVPVHIIWGERIEFIPDYIRDSLSDPVDGRAIASVTEVEDAGHMVVQEKPDIFAKAMSDILLRITPSPASSKL
ncbi:alpha/beta-hydrolase [Coprinopsis marcescibilis]|uniref:Alpha/beta-hydrolase n=1 Tax=Coprinopsis marcescibilis TaxID=230819 RepID=A0A5C3KFP7_COPMA|nr:alpha/beta-hydrolase [Coprinopsis marcescibilis]